MATTPNMGIIKPVPLSDTNLVGATDVNAGFDVIDGHNHTAGLGVQIPTLGLNINADLPLNGFGAINTKYVALNNLTTPLTAGSFKGYIYTAVGSGTGTFDLFYNDGNGANIQLTKSGQPNNGSAGNITGLTAPASASFGAGTFVWQSNTNVPAQTDTGDILLRKAGATGPLAITISTVSSLAGAYTMTLPAALPGSTQPVSMSATGQLSVGQITSAQVATNTLVGSNLANNTITATQIANGAVGQAQKAAVPEYTSLGINGSFTNTSYGAAIGTVASSAYTGRPCLVSVVSNTAGSYVGVKCTASNNTSAIGVQFGWSSDGGVTFWGESEIRTDFFVSSSAYEVRVPPGTISTVRTIGNGNFTIGLYAKITVGNASFTTGIVNGVVIKVDEL